MPLCAKPGPAVRTVGLQLGPQVTCKRLSCDRPRFAANIGGGHSPPAASGRKSAGARARPGRTQDGGAGCGDKRPRARATENERSGGTGSTRKSRSALGAACSPGSLLFFARRPARGLLLRPYLPPAGGAVAAGAAPLRVLRKKARTFSGTAGSRNPPCPAPLTMYSSDATPALVRASCSSSD